MKKFLIICFALISLSLFCGNGVASATAEETANETESDSNYSLEYNTVYWEEGASNNELNGILERNNCYSFAIGRYKNDYDISHNPGEYSNNTYSSDYSISYIAALVQVDLGALLCTGITAYVNTIPTLQPNQKLICIRKSAVNNDYHVMVYDSTVNNNAGGWLHKPGSTSVLLLNGTPNDDNNNDNVPDPWVSEYNYVGKDYLKIDEETNEVVTYTGDIYYITFYTNYNASLGGYEVSSYEQLQQIHNRPQDRWILNSSITIPSTSTWQPVEEFSGILDGNDKYIYSYKYNGLSTQNIGFIKVNNGTVKNINFSSPQISVIGSISFSNPINIGVIAAINQGSIEGCSVSGVSGEMTISSKTIANIGGICGKNIGLGNVKNCNVSGISIISNGNVGGIAGSLEESLSNSQILIDGKIESCQVANSELNVYYGAVGGIAGKSVMFISYCTVMQTVITCYNGFPEVYSSYYPASHYAYAGGIIGLDAGILYSSLGSTDYYATTINNCTLTYNSVMCNSDEVTVAIRPEMGLLCGRATTEMSMSANKYLNRYNNVTASNLTEAQSIYVSNTAYAGNIVNIN